MKTRFVVNVEGKLRSLFRVLEKRNSSDHGQTDLIIHFNKDGRVLLTRLDELLAPPLKDTYRGADVHLSVHANPRSTEGTHTVKRTIEFEDGTEVTSVLLTTALKLDRLFAPIIYVACGDLSDCRNDVPVRSSEQLISIGELDQTSDQLHFMMVLGRAGSAFPYRNGIGRRVYRSAFTHYELVVVASYFNMPSVPQHVDFVPRSSDVLGPVAGLDATSVYDTYSDINRTYARLYFERNGGLAGRGAFFRHRSTPLV